MDSTTFERVRGILVEALSVDAEEIQPDSSLHHDLGAESIDLLDITFRMEREFNIKIDSDELFPAKIFQGSDDYVKDGVVTSAGVTKLKEAVPFGDFSKVNGSLRAEDIPAIFTVTTLVKYVEFKLEQ